MRTPLQSTLAALVLLGAAACGGDDTATKTVTVAGETETVTSTQDAPAPTPTPDASPADGGNDSPGPPLPSGVVGVDGRYLLETVASDYDGQPASIKLFGSGYKESSTATTTCVAGRCSILFRLGLESGGSKAYTLRADPDRQRTYVGTGRGQVECSDPDDTKVQSRERIAVRAGSATKIGGRQVAGRLSLYATITARCPRSIATGSAVRYVFTLRGPRENPE